MRERNGGRDRAREVEWTRERGRVSEVNRVERGRWKEMREREGEGEERDRTRERDLVGRENGRKDMGRERTRKRWGVERKEMRGEIEIDRDGGLERTSIRGIDFNASPRPQRRRWR